MKRQISLSTKLALAVILLLSLAIASVASADDQYKRTYEVTVVNLTTGQWFTPPVVATHEKGFHLFERRAKATFEVKEIAENGNLQPMVDLLTDNKWVSDFEVAVAGDPPPLAPRSLVTVELTANSDHDVLSMVSMLICTNDGFGGTDSMRLPKRVGQSRISQIRGYDAGTEINTEDFADIVPPCPALTNVETTDAGTGVSNPDLAEDGVIRVHRGVNGGNDLLTDIHDWTGTTGVIIVTRTK
ncbi:MAG: spondin domain-containing protein [Chloroflexota bacterium]